MASHTRHIHQCQVDIYVTSTQFCSCTLLWRTVAWPLRRNSIVVRLPRNCMQQIASKMKWTLSIRKCDEDNVPWTLDHNCNLGRNLFSYLSPFDAAFFCTWSVCWSMRYLHTWRINEYDNRRFWCVLLKCILLVHHCVPDTHARCATSPCSVFNFQVVLSFSCGNKCRYIHTHKLMRAKKNEERTHSQNHKRLHYTTFRLLRAQTYFSAIYEISFQHCVRNFCCNGIDYAVQTSKCRHHRIFRESITAYSKRTLSLSLFLNFHRKMVDALVSIEY